MHFQPSLLALAAVPALVAPAFAAVDATAPAQELVARVTPDFASKVTFALDSKAAQPTLSTKDGKLLITAADIHEAIRAYGYYLRNLAHVHFSWNGDNASAAEFILPKQPVTVPPSTGFNYALNYCTLSYSCTHWDKKRWEHELDVFALNGYSHILVTAGLEKVWKNFLTEIGYPAAGIDKFIPNPAFGAWWNMGNLEGEGGPLSPVIMEEEAELGKFIVHRMLDLGMEPVMQGYVGFLPRDIDPASLNGKLLPQGGWVAGYMRPTVIDPTSADYPKLAAIWYKPLAAVYGYRGQYFGGDLFHEGGNTGGANLTGNIAVTGILALITFFVTQFSAGKEYWVDIVNTPGVPWWLKIPLPIMPFVELMGVFTKPFVLMVRLFANITAGHIIVLGFISLIFIFGQMAPAIGYGVSVVSVFFYIFMGCLELLVAFIQAFVFTLLSAIYIGMACGHEATPEIVQ